MREILHRMKRALSWLWRTCGLIRWIRRFRVQKPLEFLEHYFLIERSLLFDPSHYLKQSPDLQGEGFDLLAHYVALGAKQNRDPNPLFDTRYYREKYAEALA